jgi:hypothetical protein
LKNTYIRNSHCNKLKNRVTSFPFVIAIILTATTLSPAFGQRRSRSVKQPTAAIQAYEVCKQFQRTLSERLDFGAAFEVAFVKDSARRRAIAIKDGEFGDINLDTIEDSIVIGAYKSRMQIMYLILPLASPDSDEEAAKFFPLEIRQILQRKTPDSPAEFPAYAAQLEQDATKFRNHIERLSRTSPEVVTRIRDFKAELIADKFELSSKTVVRSLQYSGGGNVLSEGESYYQIEGYTVVRERGSMKLAGIRFFTRLF